MSQTASNNESQPTLSLPFLILRNLVKSEEYVRKVLPFVIQEYFEEEHQQILFSEIDKFIKQYNTIPSKQALLIELSKKDELQKNQKLIEEVIRSISTVYSNKVLDEDGSSFEWLLDTTEAWCQERALHNSIIRAVNILDGRDQVHGKHAIPKMLQDALGVSFDTNVGHDYLENFAERYELYQTKEDKIPFDIDIFNKITNGGVPKKSLNLIQAACVHPDTPVRIRIRELPNEGVKYTTFGHIERLLEQGYEVEIDSPDGFVPVLEFVHKGKHQGYEATVDGRTIIVSDGHLFETELGWMSASQLSGYSEPIDVLFEGRLEPIVVKKTDDIVPIVDCVIGHENHRYYANGISSHNTAVGKSLILCHFAAQHLLQSRNVLYITMEMAEERIAERIDANLMNVPVNQLKEMTKDVFIDRIESIRSKSQGRLIVKEFPTSGAHVGHFRALINELKIKKNFVPDVIMIDYLSICASGKIKSLGGSINSYSYVKSIAEEVRGLAIEFNVPIFSAVQSNRNGVNNSDSEITDISESFGIAMSSDLILGAISTEDLAEKGQILFKQFKNRYGDPSYYSKFFVGVDRSKMKLYELDDNVQTATSSPIGPIGPTESVDVLGTSNGGDSSLDFSSFKI